MIPSPIRIGYMSFQIEMMPEDWRDENQEGYYSNYGKEIFHESKIQIRSKMNPVAEAHVVLHEAVHALFDNFGFSSVEHDENTVDTIASGLLDLIIKNPDLIQYLKDSLA